MGYAATIGFFDGLHRGHRFLIANMQLAAMSRGLKTALITFEQHPKPGMQLLTPYDERIMLLKTAQMNQIFCFQFPVVQHMKAKEFLEVLRDRCEVKLLVMGYDHHFGADHAGFEQVQAMRLKGIEVIQAPQLEGVHISSSRIRELLRGGDIAAANEMLSYPYTLIGEVVHGKALGRQLGYPTANLQLPKDKLVPKRGVYAIKDGILNIGDTIEAHFVGKKAEEAKDLYGQTIAVSLVKRLRDEMEFETTEELKAQIEKDISQL